MKPDLLVRPIQADEIEAARSLLLAAEWDRCVSDTAEFQALLARSQITLVALEAGVVVGFLRALSDGMANGYISMLVVAEARRGTGIGRALMHAATGDHLHMTWVLRAAPNGVAEFYRKLGFTQSVVAMERPAARSTPVESR